MSIEITFLPEWLEIIWRVSVLLLGSALAGKILFGLIQKTPPLGNLSLERRWAWFGVLVFIFQNIAIQLDRFNEPVTVFGTPLTTLALAVFWIAYQKLLKDEGEGDGWTARRPQTSH